MAIYLICNYRQFLYYLIQNNIKIKAHRIIKKVARKNKYYLTTKGLKITNSILVYTRKNLLNNT